MTHYLISFNLNTGKLETSITENKKEYKQRSKGKSLLAFPEEFIVIDTESTGLDPGYCELIEFAGIKIKDGKEIGRFETLIKPGDEEDIDDFIEELTGITNEMLKNAPTTEEVMPIIADFLGDTILVAHNAHFDINFLYDCFEKYLNKPLSNDFICTMRLSRRIFPDYKNHKLKTLCKNLNIDLPVHRSLSDATAALHVFNHCKKVIENSIGIDNFISNLNKKKPGLKANQIAATIDNFDYDHPLFDKYCTFTGTLSKITRQEAMQLVVNLGGKCQDNVTKNTNYLILGIQDYSKFTDGQKSNKTKKAEELILKGQDLEIISENIFYDLILQGENF